ncbi:MAG TPA: hypothetical protein VHE37_10895 [Nevskiaceae bacterium]|nr:hypothetical protein [Nevskiaceae bacterium]
MTVETNLLQYAMLLGGVPETDRDRAQELAHNLGVEEEIIAHLILKRGAFAQWTRLQPLLRRAAATVNDGAATRREKGRGDFRDTTARRNEVYAAMTALIKQDLGEREVRSRLDQALTEALESGATPGIAERAHIRNG